MSASGATMRRSAGVQSGTEEARGMTRTAGIGRAKRGPLTGTGFALGTKGSRTRKSSESGRKTTSRMMCQEYGDDGLKGNTEHIPERRA